VCQPGVALTRCRGSIGIRVKVCADKHPARDERVPQPPVKPRLRVPGPHVVQRERSDRGIGAWKSSAQKVGAREGGGGRKPPCSQGQHFRVDIDADDPRPRASLEAPGSQRACSNAEIDDDAGAPIDGPSDGVEHLVVPRNERTNPTIVFVDGDAEMRGDAHAQVTAQGVPRNRPTVPSESPLWWSFGICSTARARRRTSPGPERRAMTPAKTIVVVRSAASAVPTPGI